ncbi:MAG: hypothetical protein RQ826_16915 [Xanthomonadales bacterium]|nr:hypothetical protein [Xanthomonadales bacterium]
MQLRFSNFNFTAFTCRATSLALRLCRARRHALTTFNACFSMSFKEIYDMNKSLMTFSALCLGAFAYSGVAVAQNQPDPLATVTPDSCDLVQIAPFGTSLLASWGWEEGTDQTKFGGDAVYEVDATVGEDTSTFEVEFELVQFEPGTLAEDYPGELVYRCSNAMTELSGSCNGSVLGLRDAIRDAAADELDVLPEEITGLVATLQGVYVKAMNPGKGNGRQNYELVDVCVEPVL